MAKTSTAKKAAATSGTTLAATSKEVRKEPQKPTAAKAKTSAAKAERPKAKNTATIKIAKGGGRRRRVQVGANGRVHQLPVDREIEVNAAVLNVLRDSNVEFETISPLTGEDAGEGSSASSTVTNTAIRAEEPDPAGPKPDEKPHELTQGGPGTEDKDEK